MDEVRNPFAPGAGTPPPELAGRREILQQAELVMARAEQGRHAKSFILVGLCGVGKTVLLVRIEQMARERKHHPLLVEATENKSLAGLLLPALRSELLQLSAVGAANAVVKRAIRVFRSFANSLKVKVEGVEVGLGIEPEKGVADTGDVERDLPELMVAVGEAAKARATVVVLLIDEIQYLTERDLSALILSIHRTSQRELPVVLIAAGLPQVVGNTGRSKSYAERLFDFPEVGPLAVKDAETAIIEPIKRGHEKIQQPAVARILELSSRYPYFLQVWAYEAWNAAPNSPIRRVHVDQTEQAVKTSLDDNFFRVRFDRLTPGEKRYLRAMAELGPGPHRSGDVAAMLAVKVTSVAPVRSALIRKGMIYSPNHGETAFTVPMFDDFLKRKMPMLE